MHISLLSWVYLETSTLNSCKTLYSRSISSLFNWCPCIMHLLQRMTSLPVCCSLVLDELFDLIPWHHIFINSHCIVFSPHVSPSSSADLFISLIFAFLSDLHKLNILSASASPTTSARSRYPSLTASLSFASALVSHPGSRQHNVSLLCFCPQLKAASACPFLSYIGLALSLPFLFTVSQCFWQSLHWHLDNFCLRNLMP